MDGTGASPIITLAVILVIFLVCREIVCWYWKQNEQVALLKEIRDMMAEQQGKVPVSSTTNSAKPTKECCKCGAKNRIQDFSCINCGNPI
jgi:hypothetical protein